MTLHAGEGKLSTQVRINEPLAKAYVRELNRLAKDLKLSGPVTLDMLAVLLSVAVAGLWARSYRGCDVLVRPSRAGDRACVTSEFGVFVFEWEAPTPGAVLARRQMPAA